MLADVKPLLDWINANPNWSGFITFLISFAESLAVVGLLFPGTVIMTAIGTLIGMGIIPFVHITLWAIAGAVLGDVSSFWLGYHYHEHVRDKWPFRKHPTLLQKGEQFFQRHGGKSVFIGRFVGPIRPILPLIAGMMSMRPLRFVLMDILSGIAWAPAYLAPGILLGYASQELPPELAVRVVLLVVVGLLGFWCISWAVKRSYRKIANFINTGFDKFWQTIGEHPRWGLLKKILIDPAHPQSSSQLALLFILVIALIVFILLAYSVKQGGDALYFNQPLYHLMRSWRTTTLDQVFVIITFLAEASVIIIWWLVVLAWLALRRFFQSCVLWLGAGLLAFSSSVVFKTLIHLPRPGGILHSPPGWSFPSGHVILALTLFGVLALIILRSSNSFIKRVITWSSVTGLTLLIAFSRLYLGAHWLSDVVGGMLIGFICLVLSALFYRRRPIPTLPVTQLFGVAFVSFVLIWSGFTYRYYIQALHDYTPVWVSSVVNAQQWWQQTNKQPVLYRNNRFGKPIQALNVQWAGNLHAIEKALLDNNWKKMPRTALKVALNNLTDKNKERQLPLLSQLYEDRKPVLVMFKSLPQLQAVLIIRLWDAHLKLSDQTPLWLGAIGYHKPWHAHFLHKRVENNYVNSTSLPDPTSFIQDDLSGFVIKKINYPQTITPVSEYDDSWDGYVVLVKPLN